MPLDESTIENATASLSDESAISFYNCSLEEMINANDLGAGSVSTIINLSGVWAATCQSGNNRMREVQHETSGFVDPINSTIGHA
jgi:hypothetical protein